MPYFLVKAGMCDGKIIGKDTESYHAGSYQFTPVSIEKAKKYKSKLSAYSVANRLNQISNLHFIVVQKGIKY